MKNVRKSKMELTGPKNIMNFRMKEISHRLGFSTYSESILSVVMADWEKS